MASDEGLDDRVEPEPGGSAGTAAGATATLAREAPTPRPGGTLAAARPAASAASAAAPGGVRPPSSAPPAARPGDGALRAGWLAARAALAARHQDDTRGTRIPLGGGRQLRVTRRGAVVGGVILAIAIMIIVGLGTAGDGGGSTPSYSLPAPAAIKPDVAAGNGVADSAAGSAGSGIAERAAPPAATSVVGPVDPAPTPGGASGAARPAGAEPRIVWTGSMSVEVPAGTVEPAIRKIANVATGLGGYLADSQVSGTATATDDARQSATITLRVPAGSFTKLQDAVGGAGTVLTSTMSSKDVTAEYVDLEARLSALGTSRTTYLTLLGKATTVGEILQVQQQIDGVQTQIEQLEGQRKVLADQSDLATLTINLAEKGAQSGEPKGENGFLHALRAAWHDFVAGLENIISALGVIALIILVVAVLYLLYRLPRALRRRGAPRPTGSSGSGDAGTGSPPAAEAGAASADTTTGSTS
ncbi:DUF4349 domain-containing protein [Pseudofrankia sp. BMG5.37]|uniref:DUF4349 domain-containing protein n=1 Tax=Pseudofrankia sp. BMG5.37 TaxID=3050035 RepID=UPI00289572A8|nr:DUF4349 domain-containing protein [Pseudofrankia sp. BMG5.37]MDT3445397.1 DUF4349 domain-containing protein [Pseudofrankia sp. BMG5.37]